MPKLNLSLDLLREAYETKCKLKEAAGHHAATLESVGQPITKDEALNFGQKVIVDITQDYYKKTGVENNHVTNEWIMGLYRSLTED